MWTFTDKATNPPGKRGQKEESETPPQKRVCEESSRSSGNPAINASSASSRGQLSPFFSYLTAFPLQIFHAPYTLRNLPALQEALRIKQLGNPSIKQWQRLLPIIKNAITKGNFARRIQFDEFQDLISHGRVRNSVEMREGAFIDSQKALEKRFREILDDRDKKLYEQTRSDYDSGEYESNPSSYITIDDELEPVDEQVDSDPEKLEEFRSTKLELLKMYKGKDYYDKRWMLVSDFFGVEIPIPRIDEDRRNLEKYGYLAYQNPLDDLKKNNPVEDYGEILIIFNKERIKHRTTMFFGDTLENFDVTFEAGARLASFVDDPQIYSVTETNSVNRVLEKLIGQGYDLRQLEDDPKELARVLLGQMPGSDLYHSYIELQFHGDLTFDDIQEIYIPRNYADDVSRLVNSTHALSNKIRSYD